MMNPKTFLALSLSLLAGCSSRAVDFAISRDHPAHPDAAQAPYLLLADPLSTEASSPGTASRPAETARVVLPTTAAEHLTQLLRAYLTIGDRLAADTVQDVSAQARHVDKAMAALAKVVFTDEPHFWHHRQEDAQTIRKQAQALADATDLKPARIAYGKLSDALERLTKEIGVPPGFDEPVYSFTCGMFEAAPRDGVWLQIGDDARNPYYGSTMLACYRTEYELPTVKGTQAKSDPHHHHGGHGHDKNHGYQQGGSR